MVKSKNNIIELLIFLAVIISIFIFLIIFIPKDNSRIDRAEYLKQQIETGQENMKYFSNNMTINQAIMAYKMTQPYSGWYLKNKLEYVCGD